MSVVCILIRDSMYNSIIKFIDLNEFRFGFSGNKTRIVYGKLKFETRVFELNNFLLDFSVFNRK